MSHPDNRRKSRFRAALAFAEMTADQWAEDQGITASYLSQVLAGKKESQSLLEKVDAFTRDQISKHATAA